MNEDEDWRAGRIIITERNSPVLFPVTGMKEKSAAGEWKTKAKIKYTRVIFRKVWMEEVNASATPGRAKGNGSGGK